MLYIRISLIECADHYIWRDRVGGGYGVGFLAIFNIENSPPSVTNNFRKLQLSWSKTLSIWNKGRMRCGTSIDSLLGN